MLCIYDNETTISLNNDNITMNSTIIKNDEDLMSNTIFKNVLIACYVLIFLITFIGEYNNLCYSYYCLSKQPQNHRQSFSLLLI